MLEGVTLVDEPEEGTSGQPSAESESEFADLTDSEALAAAKRAFGDVLAAELIPEPNLPEGASIKRYLDDSTALVSTSTLEAERRRLIAGRPSTNLLLDSSLPLIAPENGTMKPLSEDLVLQEDYYEAANSVVNAEIAKNLTDGATLPGVGLTVVPSDVDDADPKIVHDKVFFPNAGDDTDYIVTPTALGFQYLMQLRSSASPTDLRLDVSGDGEVYLESAPDGSLVVKRDLEPIATIAAPRAVDANGHEVQVAYSVNDSNTFTVQVDTETPESLEWPVLVDPIVDEYNWGQNQSNPDLAYWTKATNFPAGFSSFYHAGEGGIMNRALGGKTFSQWSFTEWIGQSIRSSFVERVDFLNFDRTPTQPGACTVLGIFQPAQSSWASTVYYNPADGSYVGGGGYGWCGNVLHESRFAWVGFNAMPDGPGGDPEAADGSQAIFMLQSSPGVRSSPAENLLRGVKMYRYDTNAPVVSSASSGWTKVPTFAVHDQGLGAAAVWVLEPNTYQLLGASVPTCSGGRQSVCPVDANLGVNDLPEGRYDAIAVGLDPVWNGSAGYTFSAAVDRTGPEQTWSGSLAAISENMPIYDGAGPFTLNVSATDGPVNPSNNSERRAGVAYIQVLLDGALVAAEGNFGATDNSPLSINNVSIDTNSLGCSLHEVRVLAVDRAGNVSEETLGFQRIRAGCGGTQCTVVPQAVTETPNGETDTGPATKFEPCLLSTDVGRAQTPNCKEGQDFIGFQSDGASYLDPNADFQIYCADYGRCNDETKYKMAHMAPGWNDRVRVAGGASRCNRFRHFVDAEFEGAWIACGLIPRQDRGHNPPYRDWCGIMSDQFSEKTSSLKWNHAHP